MRNHFLLAKPLALLAGMLFAAPVAAQVLSGGTFELHEGGFLSADTAVLSDTTGNVRLERGTLGELGAGLSTGIDLRLRAGTLHLFVPLGLYAIPILGP